MKKSSKNEEEFKNGILILVVKDLVIKMGNGKVKVNSFSLNSVIIKNLFL